MNPFFKAIALIAVMSAAITFTACEQAHTCTYNESTSTLSCPEKAYKTVTLAGKVWMAENMDIYIPDSSICYGNSHSNCETMGRLYTWNAATNGLCPNGWKLPSQQAFREAFGNASTADLKKEGGFNMQFAFNDSTAILNTRYQNYLNQIAEDMKENPEKIIMITGHTCDIGSYDANYKVALRRAGFAKQQLMQRGISADRIKTQSKAYLEPLVPNTSEDNRKINRRIEFKYLKE